MKITFGTLWKIFTPDQDLRAGIHLFSQFFQRPLGKKPALFDQSVSCADLLRISELMCTEKHRRPLFSCHLPYETVYILGALRIKPGRRFIKE